MNKMKIFIGFLLFFISNAIFAGGGQKIGVQQYGYLGDINGVDSRPYIVRMKACKGTGRVKTNKKVIALTFDDGPHGEYTNSILDILRLKKVKATFFFIGRNVTGNELLVKKVFDDGHVIGNHSYSHDYLDGLSWGGISRELTKTSRLIGRIAGKYPVLFRPPYGSCSRQSAMIVKYLGFKTIMWSVSVDDYRENITVDEIVKDIVNLVKPGAIICLHDGGGNRKKTVEALPIIIDSLRKKGYGFSTIPDLLNVKAYLRDKEI